MRNLKHLYSIISILLLVFIFHGCASGPTIISNSIPYDVQQLIKVIKSENVSYSYVPNPQGDKIEVGGTSYSVNVPLKSLFNELIQTKFQNIQSDASNKIEILLKDVKPEYIEPSFSAPSHNLGLTVEVKVVKDGKVNSKSFSYSTTTSIKKPGMATVVDTKPIHELLLKFVVAIDKFIDTQYNVQ